MQLLTTFIDKKIEAENHLIQMTIGEYSKIAIDILHNNDLQRKRVKTSNRSYSLLKDDIKVGCVIPPIVLAIFPTDHQKNVIDGKNIIEIIQEKSQNLLILDGLQRTYTILDLLTELHEDHQLLKMVSELPLRIEVYTGISKVGVLYRMLTLNTGQTPMSTRQQVEMLYSDYKGGFDELKFITESDDKLPSGNNEFSFGDILDGFLSYITGDYLPIDREDLIAIIKNLENLSKEDKQKDLFKILIRTYNKLRIKIDQLSNNWKYVDETKSLLKKPFAFSVNELFTKVQVIAGFGAAINFLIEENLIKNIEVIEELIDQISNEGITEALDKIIVNLDEVQQIAKKIGNDQRMFFYYFVRNLFNETNEGYLNVGKAVQQAFKFYKANR